MPSIKVTIPLLCLQEKCHCLLQKQLKSFETFCFSQPWSYSGLATLGSQTNELKQVRKCMTLYKDANPVGNDKSILLPFLWHSVSPCSVRVSKATENHVNYVHIYERLIFFLRQVQQFQTVKFHHESAIHLIGEEKDK